jgi:hypothetical protein
MGLTSVTGLLSRYFAVGFFLPAYFTLLALWAAASQGLVPNDFERYKGATQIAILGGIALLAALALSGFNHAIFRLFEGYPLQYGSRRPIVGRLYRWRLRAQQGRWDDLMCLRWAIETSEPDRQRAAVDLGQLYPTRRDALLPTRFGNAIRAFEQHSSQRYGLNAIVVWPRVEMLLTTEEREPLVESKIDVNVFMNAAVGALVVGLVLIFDMALNAPTPAYLWWLYVTPFVLAFALYGPMVGAAVRWGSAVRAGIDLHRLDVYAKLGVRRPTSFSDERYVARQVNLMLLYATAPPDDLWRAEEPVDALAPSTAAGEADGARAPT